MTADILGLGCARRDRELRRALDQLRRRLGETPLPDPEALGWSVVGRDEEGRAVRWFCTRYRALAGYVPGSPELVYVDYRHTTFAYELSLEELLLGLETGCLPDPVAEVGEVGAPGTFGAG